MWNLLQDSLSIMLSINLSVDLSFQPEDVSTEPVLGSLVLKFSVKTGEVLENIITRKIKSQTLFVWYFYDINNKKMIEHVR